MSWKGYRPTQFALDVIEESEDYVKKVASVGLQSVVTSSPVMDGAYRGNHRISINEEDHTFDENIKDLGGQSTISKESAKIVKFKLGDKLYIQNNVPYAVRLEGGHSGQAPHGVYSIAFMNMRNIK